jgi:hypothetical protein
MVEYISGPINSTMVKKEMLRHATAKSVVNPKMPALRKPIEACVITSCHLRGTKRASTQTPGWYVGLVGGYHSARRPALCRDGAVSGLFAELAHPANAGSPGVGLFPPT